MVYIFFFFIMLFMCTFLYGILVISAIFVVLSRDTVFSLFFFICVYFSSSLILIFLGFDFWGLMLLTIYIGAIVVLFLFVVMMVRFKEVYFSRSPYTLFGLFILKLLFLEFIYLLISYNEIYMNSSIIYNNNFFLFEDFNCLDEVNRVLLIKKLSYLLFYEYPIFLFVASILLLVAMVGAIYLTNIKKGFTTRLQYNQLLRNNRLFYVRLY